MGRYNNNRPRKNNKYGGITLYAKPFEATNRSTGEVFTMLKGKSVSGKITCTATQMSKDWQKQSGDSWKITVFGVGKAIYKARRAGYASAMKRRNRTQNSNISMKDLLTVLASK